MKCIRISRDSTVPVTRASCWMPVAARPHPQEPGHRPHDPLVSLQAIYKNNHPRIDAREAGVRSIEVAAGVIEYDEAGSGPPVVLLHGLLMDHTLWDRVLPLLPGGFRYIRPVFPLGAHRRAMNPGTDLSLPGQVRIVADFLDALSLESVTLVHSDWGGALFLTAHGLDDRVARQVILPCEAFGNFPPGLPGKMVALAARLPAGIQLAARQLRPGWLRRLPMLYGQMARAGRYLTSSSGTGPNRR